jgi:hypothetical protein
MDRSNEGKHISLFVLPNNWYYYSMCFLSNGYACARKLKAPAAPCISQTEVSDQRGREVYSIVRAKFALCRSNESNKRSGNRVDERGVKKVGGGSRDLEA